MDHKDSTELANIPSRGGRDRRPCTHFDAKAAWYFPSCPVPTAQAATFTNRAAAPANAGAHPRARGCGVGLTIRTAWQTLHQMVNYHKQFDRTFAALADPTRRAILAQLERQDSASVSELARPFAIKLPAVMKHLDVLDDAGLITRSKAGRIVTVRLSSEPIREVMNWLRRYERFWSGNLDRLTAYTERKEAEARKRR
jgi:DNA-binding transcriptional ArsR family regulator